MQLNEYQMLAMSFRLPSANQIYAITGLTGEVGEFNSLIAKSVRDHKGLMDVLVVKKEIGDILWFVAAIAADYGFSLNDIAMSNIEKLNSRKARNTIQGSGDDR